MVLLVAVTAVVIGTLAWNGMAPKRFKLSFDNAEKLIIYLLALILIFVAVYSSLSEG